MTEVESRLAEAQNRIANLERALQAMEQRLESVARKAASDELSTFTFAQVVGGQATGTGRNMTLNIDPPPRYSGTLTMACSEDGSEVTGTVVLRPGA